MSVSLRFVLSTWAIIAPLSLFACGDTEGAGGVQQDSAVSRPDGSGAAEADASTDASHGDDARELPAEVSDDVSGDYHIAAGNTARINPPAIERNIVLDGNLEVREGATLLLAWGLTIKGTLTFRAGARVMSEESGPFRYLRPQALVAEGTAADPVRIGAISFLGTSCDVAYAEIGPGLNFKCNGFAHVRDTHFFNAYAHFDGRSEEALIEHCLFEESNLSIARATLRASELRASGASVVRAETGNNGVKIACEGNRDRAQDVIVEGNAFTAFVGHDPQIRLFTVEREYGPIDLHGNYFDSSLDGAEINTWNGSSTGGCQDGLAAYGGPLALTPTLSTRLDGVGPR